MREKPKNEPLGVMSYPEVSAALHVLLVRECMQRFCLLHRSPLECWMAHWAAACPGGECLTGFPTLPSVGSKQCPRHRICFCYLKRACLLLNNSSCRPEKSSGKPFDVWEFRDSVHQVCMPHVQMPHSQDWLLKAIIKTHVKKRKKAWTKTIT